MNYLKPQIRSNSSLPLISSTMNKNYSLSVSLPIALISLVFGHSYQQQLSGLLDVLRTSNFVSVLVSIPYIYRQECHRSIEYYAHVVKEIC